MSLEEIFAEDEDGNITDTRIGYLVEADPVLAKAVMDAPINDDGRSPWFWLRLADGSLMLACFPRGETYEITENDINRP